MKQHIRIDGEITEPPDGDVLEVEPGVYSAIVDGQSWEACVSGNEISVAGRMFRFEIDDPRRWNRSGPSRGSQGRVTLSASMPGKVVRVLVAVGDDVGEGQGIVVVEAMKMQNELKAPRAGRVTSIEVKPSDSVNAGAVLATIE